MGYEGRRSITVILLTTQILKARLIWARDVAGVVKCGMSRGPKVQVVSS